MLINSFNKNLFKLLPFKCLKYLAPYTILLVYCYFNWASLYILNVFILLSCLLSFNYVSLQGLIRLNFLITVGLMVRSWFLFYSSIAHNISNSWYLGGYASINDVSYLSINFILDSYNLSFITLTISIGSWAILYAHTYMRNEPRVFSFIWLLLSFLYSMILLLAGDSFTTILLGWELIGSFSFLLINFWTTRVSTFKSALKAFFFNKLSDLCLIVIIIVFLLNISSNIHNFTYITTLYNTTLTLFNLNVDCSNFFLFFLSVCCFCKSAQFGFHVWLPDSMEAPVPASALIHSATLVSAGIYLFGRVPSFLINDLMYNYIALVSSFTAFYGGIIASYQTDLKRILAYSTISHCGFLFFLLVLGNYYNLVVYLHMHGWFKSLSFMCAGNIIGSNNNYQDYRRMGANNSSLRFEQVILSLSILNLGSLPFLLGFFNKHFLLTLFHNTNVSLIASCFIILASFTGIFYSIKFLYGVFYSCDKRPYSLKKNNYVIYTSSSYVSNATGSNKLSLVSLIGLVLVTVLTSLSLVLHSSYGSNSSLLVNYYNNHTLLSYINIYMVLLLLPFYYKSARILLFLLFLCLLKSVFIFL